MRLADFDYNLPPELIAQEPMRPRDRSRMLVLHRASGAIEHRRFADLPQYLRAGDVAVFNDTRVFPARLRGRRVSGLASGEVARGAAADVLLLREARPGAWEALVKPGRRVRAGDELLFGDGELRARVAQRMADGKRLLLFSAAGDVDATLERLGETPLPPYIRRAPKEDDDY
jgi:S-adenosylmethionine:tRNA ribosyltransferase-isomerase